MTEILQDLKKIKEELIQVVLEATNANRDFFNEEKSTKEDVLKYAMFIKDFNLSQ